MDPLTPQQVTDIENHLRSRGLDPGRTQVILDKQTNQATFILYNLSGQLVGYQKYNPNGDKKAFNDSKLGRYFTYVTKESEKSSKMAVWGTETITKDVREFFVTEGIFDAIKLHNAGKAAIAVLSNNPKVLKSWFKATGKKTIAIIDNDEAGRKLGNLTDERYTPPEGKKDLGEMTQSEVNQFLSHIGYQVEAKEMSSEQLALQYIGDLVKGTPFEGKTFLAGGAVRDELMGKPVKDIDIVVSMPNGGIEFANWITKKIGAYKEGANPVTFPRFGTAKLNLRGAKVGGIDISNVDIEVVMTRGEKYEKGSRKPEVVYADLKDDAYRRDLTVNSLFKDVVTGKIEDLTGLGIADIQAGIVRTPLDPDQTFKDDPLRMLRAVRFAVKYNWKMPKSLVQALRKNSDMLQTISKERIRDELDKILMTQNPDKGLKILSWSGLNRFIIPELDACIGVTQNEYHKDDVFGHIIEVVKNTSPDLTARLGSLFHDIGKPQTRSVGEDGRVHFYKHEDVGAEMAKEIMSRLKYTNVQIETVSSIVSHHMELKSAGPDGSNASDKQLRKFMARLGPVLVPALKTMHADNISHSEFASMPNQIANLAKRMEELKLQTNTDKPKLPINGNDVIQALGIKPGPDVKKYLSAVEDEWFKNPNISRDDALNLIKKMAGKTTTRRNLKDLLNQTIINPKTGNKILVRTALKYDASHPAKQAALNLIRRA